MLCLCHLSHMFYDNVHSISMQNNYLIIHAFLKFRIIPSQFIIIHWNITMNNEKYIATGNIRVIDI